MTLPKQKAARLLSQARALLQRGDTAQVERIAAQLLGESKLDPGPILALRAEARLASGQDGVASYREALLAHPDDPHLNVGLANALVRRGDPAAAVPLFAKASPGFKKDPAFLMNQGHALVQAGRLREGKEVLARAAATGGGARARLFLANALAALEEWDAAEEACRKLEGTEVVSAARDLRAECRLFRGDAAGALVLWRPLRDAGALPAEHLSHMACAAQLASEPELAKTLMTERLGTAPTPEDFIFAAEIALARGEDETARAYLEQANTCEGARYPDFDADRQELQNRIERDATVAMNASPAAISSAAPGNATSAAILPTTRIAASVSANLAPASTASSALTISPSPSSVEGQRLLQRFRSREKEVESLRREVERLKAARARAEQRAQAQLEEVRERSAVDVQTEAKRVAAEELRTREQEAQDRAEANVDRALGEA
ncbi:MAG: tetratricopeptide repeat protein, partial [Myxococcaceae bacterium]